MIKNKLYRKLISLSHYLFKIGGNDYFNPASIEALDYYKKFIDFIIENFDQMLETAYPHMYISLNRYIIPYVRYIERSNNFNIP